jgi:hypothetical protein
MDRAFDIGVVVKMVALTWRAGSLGRTAEVATDECSAISPPMLARHTHRILGPLLGANVFRGTADKARCTARAVIRS